MFISSMNLPRALTEQRHFEWPFRRDEPLSLVCDPFPFPTCRRKSGARRLC